MIQEFDGKFPVIAKSAFISDSAVIIGDVEIGEGSSVWPGAVIRGDVGKIIVGSNCHVEDNCVLHSATGLTIEDNVIIGHGAVVHCSRIGFQSLIGSNATVLDDTEIADYCMIGAGSLVSAGMVLPSRSLAFGMPARIKGEISQEQLNRLISGAKYYAGLVRKYMVNNSELKIQTGDQS